MHLAPGLTDLIELAARSSVLDMSMDENASLCCGDDLSVGGMNSLPGSAVKRAPRKAASGTPGSASRSRVPVVPRGARVSSARSARVSRPSYAENDQDSSDLDEEDSEPEVESESSGSDSDGDAEANNAWTGAADGPLSPTKQFVTKTKGKARASKSSAIKKISFEESADKEESGVRGRKGSSK